MIRPNYNVFCGDVSGITGQNPKDDPEERISHGQLVTKMRRAETRVCQKLNPNHENPDILSEHIARQIEEVAQVTATRFCREPMLCEKLLAPDHYPPLDNPAFLEMTGRIEDPAKKSPTVSVEVYLEEVYSGKRKLMWKHEFSLKAIQ